MSHKELLLTLSDIGLDLQDDNFYYNVSNIQYTQTLYVTVTIHNKGNLFKGSSVADVIERLIYFMKDQGWRLWLDIHLYTDYHIRQTVSPVLQREKDYYHNLFRNDLEYGRNGEGAIQSIKLRFETWNYNYK